MVSFGWPLAFMLLPLPLLLRLVNKQPPAEAGLPIPPMLAQAFDAVASKSQRSSRLLLSLTWICWGLLVISIAQPSLVAGSAIRPATGRAMIVAIDLSSSMERRDFVLEGEAVDRLTALKSIARSFIRARQGDRLGLVLFGDEAFSAAPISYDLASISNVLEESAIGMAGRATAIGDAIGLAIVKLRADPAIAKDIVLLSDGTNNSGTAEPEDAARIAKSLGIRILTIGMGSARGASGADPIDPSADLDEETLQQIAELSGGRFFRARTTEELGAVYAELDRLARSEGEAPPVVPKLDIRNWTLLALALCLAAVAMLRAGRRTT